jgi:hypothetical protein
VPERSAAAARAAPASNAASRVASSARSHARTPGTGHARRAGARRSSTQPAARHASRERRARDQIGPQPATRQRAEPVATTAVASARRPIRVAATRSGDADRARRLALAGGALLALSLASLGLLVVARSGSGGRLRGG